VSPTRETVRERVAREERLLVERYRRRAEQLSDRRYEPLNQSSFLAVQQRDRMLTQRLAREGMMSLKSANILDVGCGNGVELVRLLPLGADPSHLYGIDLLPERVAAAKLLHPAMNVVRGSATALPWPAGTFDIVMQYTTFSSILDPVVRRIAAGEMARVMRPNGMLIWYDFVVNPLNVDTRGVSRRAIRALFPTFDIWVRPVTLAPPLSRHLALTHPLLAQALQAFRPLCSHLLAVLRKAAAVGDRSPDSISDTSPGQDR
jgi:ubiquinone/menaquinone biosynthesis C-methylase UbiE